MTQLTFPIGPTLGQQYTAQNGATYEWTGKAWKVLAPPVPTTFTNLITFLQGLALANGQTLVSEGPGVVGLRLQGTDPNPPNTIFNIYPYYKDANNWTRVVFDTSFGDIQIRIESDGDGHMDRSGSIWLNNFFFRTNIGFIGDNEVDVGTPSQNRPRMIYVGTAVHAPTQPPGTNDDTLATTEFVTAAIAAALGP